MGDFDRRLDQGPRAPLWRPAGAPMRDLLCARLAFLVLLALGAGCEETRHPGADVPAARKDLSSEVEDATRDDVVAEAAEVAADGPDGDATTRLDADAGSDARDEGDVPRTDLGALDTPDSIDAGDAWDPMYRVDRPEDDCVLPAPDVAVDAEPPCTAGRTRACTCADGARGAAWCTIDGRWEFCRCESGDAGAPGEMDAGPPAITVPRLLAPISGLRVTSQRPTLRWSPPMGAARSRVELCDDRPCTRPLVTRELTASSWRPDAPLRPGPVFWRVRALDPSGAVTWTSATWLFGVRHRDTPVDSSYGVMRDHNGDGYDDLVAYINHYPYDPEGGFDGIQVYFGSATGLSVSRRRTLLPGPTHYPAGPGESFAVGDVNGDGLADIAMGDSGTGVLAGVDYAAKVYVYLGSRTCLTRQGWGLPLAPTAVSPSRYGISIGDFNGDGFADVVAGSEQGGLRMFAGGPDGPGLVAVHTTAQAGLRSYFVGDINNDGYNDFIAQHPRGQDLDNWPVYVFYGNPGGRFDFFVQTIQPPCPGGFRCNNYLGHAIRGADLDEDGFSDVILAESAAFHVLRGSRDGLRYLGERRGTADTGCGTFACNFAGSVSSPGDLDGDGHLEFAVGAEVSPRDPITDRIGPGQVFLFPHTALNAAPMHNRTLSGAAPLRYFGGVSPLLDVNGDGFDDLVVRADQEVPRPPPANTIRAVLSVYLGEARFTGAVPPATLAPPEYKIDGPVLE